VLGQLAALTKIPRPDRVVQSSRPQSCPVCAHVDAGGAVRVTLELPHQRLIVQIPHGNVSV
jgi:hypothetical protein